MIIRVLLRVAAPLGLLLASCAAAAAPSIAIQSPLDGTTVNPGQTVTVTVTGTDLGQPAISFLLLDTPLTTNNYAANSGAPFSFSFTVPTYVEQRAYKVRAIARLATGEVVKSQPIHVLIQRADLPVSIYFSQSNLKLRFVGDQSQADLVAIYADGKQDSVRSDARALFTSENPAIFSTSNDGTITGKSAGVALLKASFGTLTAVAPIQVAAQQLRGDLNGDGAVDQNDINLLMLYLNQLASGPGDARDLNGDGKIDALDLRVLTTLCTKPRCAIQ